MIDSENIPDKMLTAKRWLVWRSEPNKDITKKPRKVPYYTNGSHRQGVLESDDDIKNLSSFEAAVRALSTNKYTGIGFAFGEDNHSGKYFQGIDIDKISAHPELQHIVDDFPSYVEKSPSGDGYHAIGYGRKFDALGSNESGIEAYSFGRYFTVTGVAVSGYKLEDLSSIVEQRLKPIHSITNKKFVDDEGFSDPELISIEDIRLIRSALNCFTADDRDRWIRYGQALCRLGHVGRSLWMDWSQQSDKHDPLGDSKTWESFRGDKTGFPAILKDAYAFGWDGKKSNRKEPKQPEEKKEEIKTVDIESSYSVVDFLKHVPEDHFLKTFSLQVAAMCKLPENSVFITGLAIYASLACRKWCVNYEHGGKLPIGLYVVVEQPSGAAKSWCCEVFQKPFFEAHKESVKRLKDDVLRAEKLCGVKSGNAEQDAINKDILAMAKNAFKRYSVGLFTSNTTPEALEKKLIHTDGYFSAVSSEQGLFSTLIGGMYSKGGKRNDDVILNGYNGGFINTSRVMREGYSGRVIGGVLTFAQSGSIETILRESQGTGLAERFLFIREKHLLGARDHSKNYLVDYSILSKYSELCGFINNVITNPIDCDSLCTMEVSRNGFNLIIKYRNRLEPHMADGGKYSSLSLRGMISKIDITILKFAANLQLTSGRFNTSVIDDDILTAAIGMAGEFIEAYYEAAKNHGTVGRKAEHESILSLFEKDQRPRVERNIIIAKNQTNPFKYYAGNKSEAIRVCLAEMVEEGLLKVNFQVDVLGGLGPKTYSLA